MFAYLKNKVSNYHWISIYFTVMVVKQKLEEKQRPLDQLVLMVISLREITHLKFSFIAKQVVTPFNYCQCHFTMHVLYTAMPSQYTIPFTLPFLVTV